MGEAENGREALEIAEKITPDLVITDIKMPFMDGLQLSAELKKITPITKIVILTGFDQFDYAHKAIGLNVTDYVLKPISASDLKEILLKLKLQLDEELAKIENLEALKSHFIKSLPILKEKFFSTLITNKLTDLEIKEKCRSYSVDFQGNYFAVSKVGFDLNKLKDHAQARFEGEKELLKYAVLNIIADIENEGVKKHAFLHNDNIVLILYSLKTDRDTTCNDFQNLLEEIRLNIEKYLKSTVTLGLGNVVSDLTMLQESWGNANSALDYKVVTGDNRVIWIEDIEPESKNSIVFDDNLERSLESSIKVGTEKEVKEIIDKIFLKILDADASFKDYQIYLLEILTSILKAAKSANVDLTSILGENNNLFAELYSFQDFTQVIQWFNNISIKIMNNIMQERKDSYEVLVEKAKNFMQDNFKNSELTIVDVCNHLHISQTYFSLIFKKETKQTFTTYLTSIRMREAKKLLKSTNIKTLVIAREVGYSEPNYFSYCFKKQFGISPSEYRG